MPSVAPLDRRATAESTNPRALSSASARLCDATRPPRSLVEFLLAGNVLRGRSMRLRSTRSIRGQSAAFRDRSADRARWLEGVDGQPGEHLRVEVGRLLR